MQWLWYSLVASVVLTVVANVAIRRWPDAARRGSQRLLDGAERHRVGDGTPQPRVRVIVPWRAMLVVSVVATVLLNVLLRV